MELPFSHIGIGRSNNFIEHFTVGTYHLGHRQLRQWTPIIPKSILFVDADGGDSASSWRMVSLSKPTDKMPLVIMIDGLILLVLGLVIIVLWFKEKAEDKKQSDTAFDYF